VSFRKIVRKSRRRLAQEALLLVPPLRRALRPRRFQAYCVGTGKSGTHSIHGMLRERYRSAHEPENTRVAKMLLAAAEGGVSPEKVAKFVLRRDRRLWLEVESSFMIVFYLDVLLREFPDAKVILTIRDCYSWLDSKLNEGLWRPTTDLWRAFDALRYGRRHEAWAPEEEALKANGFYSVAAYLAQWAWHNRTVLETVPPERLLVVRTHEITPSIPNIADFLGIPADHLDPGRSHRFKTKQKSGLVAGIDRSFLEDQADRHCRDLMDRFFPGTEAGTFLR
jgi:Sulfotransferase domain